jgi:PAS domain S-box-containing protein
MRKLSCLCILVVIVLLAYFFISFYDDARMTAIRQLNDRQMLHAKQASQGISDFFDNWARMMTYLAELKPIQSFDDAGKTHMETFHRLNADTIRGISRLDARGIIIYAYPPNPSAINADVSGQKHVQEILRTHQPVISDVFSSAQGFDTVAMHVPVFRNGTFDGTLAVLINFQEVARRFVEGIKIGETGYAWMISRDGTELYCPVPGHTGHSVFENCRDFPSILAMAKEMLQGKEGTTTYDFNRVAGEKVEALTKFAVYRPIKVGNTFWSIVVASAADEMIESLRSFRNRLIVIIGLMLVAGVLFSYYGVRAWLVIREEAKRRRVEDSLRASEERLRVIFDTSFAGIILGNPEGIVTYANHRMAQMFGCRLEELVGSPYSSLVHPDEQSIGHAVMWRLIVNEIESVSTERHYLRKDGSDFWGYLSARRQEDANGKLMNLVGIISDITELKQAQDALRESRQQLADIINFLPDATLVIDQEGKVIAWNQAIEEMTGINAADILGKGNYEYALPFYNDRRPILVDLALHPELEKDCDYVRIRRSGDVVYGESITPNLPCGGAYLSGNASVLRNSRGDIAGAIECIRDSTERMRAEAEIRTLIERFQTILSHLFVGIMVVTKDDRIEYANHTFCDLLDITATPSELIGLSAEEVLQKILPAYVDPTEALSRIREIVDTGGRVEGEEVPMRSGRVLLRDFIPIFIDGKQSGRLWQHRDITERKRIAEERRRLEERLQRAEKMEALGTLAGGVAHDLNNVLGIIVGFSELLLDKLDESTPARHHAVEVYKGGERAAAIVQDLLTLARRGVPSRKVLNLNHVVIEWRDSPECAKLSSCHPHIETVSDLEPDLLNISGSSVHLGKSFINLLANAAEAMPEGGLITIKTGNEYLDKPISGYDEVREGDYVVLSVSDTGEGIPTADLKRIFEPFYTKKVMGRSGTGLGLAVVWGTVKDHHGYIDVQSVEGTGTTFTLYFPVTREELSLENAAVAVSEYLGNGETLLVVDDVKEQRDLATIMLQKLNYRIVTAASGEAAVAYLKEQAVDLVVLDMIMDPGMDGLETYLKILEIHPHQKAIIVSGFAETERVYQAQALGAGAYVKKPYALEKLGLAIRRELARSI